MTYRQSPESTTEYSGSGLEGGPRDVTRLGDAALMQALRSDLESGAETRAAFRLSVKAAHLRIEDPLFRDQQPPATQ